METTTLLKALQKLMPARVDAKVIQYLERLETDDVALELLRDQISKTGG